MLTIILAVLSAVPVLAGNPADVTDDFRVCPVKYYKFAYDGGPWYVLALEPIGDDASTFYIRWEDPGSDLALNEFAGAKVFNDWLEAGVVLDVWENQGDISYEPGITLDLKKDGLGLGAVVPLKSPEDFRLGPRLTSGDWTAYLTLRGNGAPSYGLSYCGDINAHLAHGQSSWQFRASKTWGEFTPELRTKFTSGETFIGFGLGYSPN